MAIATTAAIILALKAAQDIARDARDSDDPATLKKALQDLSRMLTGTISDLCALQIKVLDLKTVADGSATQRVWRFASEDEKIRYVRVRSQGGAFVYIDEHMAHAPAMAPEYCARCFESGTRATLQPMGVGGFSKCPACGAAPCTGR